MTLLSLPDQPLCWSYRQAWPCLAFCMGARDSNSGLHSPTASALTHEGISQLLSMFLFLNMYLAFKIVTYLLIYMLTYVFIFFFNIIFFLENVRPLCNTVGSYLLPNMSSSQFQIFPIFFFNPPSSVSVAPVGTGVGPSTCLPVPHPQRQLLSLCWQPAATNRPSARGGALSVSLPVHAETLIGSILCR